MFAAAEYLINEKYTFKEKLAIATLQEKHKGKNPVLIRIETRSGHGASSTTNRVEETADKFAFMFHAMSFSLIIVIPA